MTKVFTKNKKKYAFKNLDKAVIISTATGSKKIKLADALGDEEIMNDLISLKYGGLVEGPEAEKIVKAHNNATELRKANAAKEAKKEGKISLSSLSITVDALAERVEQLESILSASDKTKEPVKESTKK